MADASGRTVREDLLPRSETFVLHRCDNPPCCNPRHLFTGSHQTNVDDMVAKGRHMHGDRHYLRRHPERKIRGTAHAGAKLTETDVLAIRAAMAVDDPPTQRELAAQFGVSRGLIGLVTARKIWTHV